MPPRNFESSLNSTDPPTEEAAASQPQSEIHSAAETAQPKNWRRGFWSLIATQFQAAFSENMLKWTVSFIILGMAIPHAQRDRLFVLIVPLLFSIPFLLFSMAGGFLADHFSKRSVTIATKYLEMAIAGVALIGLALHSLPIECASVFLISTQAALFGPSKYGLLPELLPESKLSWGNGYLENFTFLAILLGTLVAGQLSTALAGREYWAGAILIGLACIGLATSVGISKVPAARPQSRLRLNPLGDLIDQIRLIRKDRVLSLAVIGNIYFWFLGSFLLINVVLYAKDILHASDTRSSLLIAAVSVGIAIGSVAAGYLSGNKIEYGLIPLGMIGMTIVSALLFRHGLSYNAVAGLLAILGFFAGFFSIPINALIQHRPDPATKGGILAAANLLSFVGIAAQPVAQYAMIFVGHPNPATTFLICSVMTLGATVYVCWMLPDALLRLVLWMLTLVFYKIRVVGRENIPERGGALFVANHLSLVDALLLIAACDRPIRFLIFEDIYNHPVVKPFAAILHAIPISSTQRPRDLIKALRTASDAIRDGEVVCIFAEGEITRLGRLLPFRRGFERIMQDLDAPIIPVSLDGVWGSIFSYEGGRFFWKFPRQIPYRVSVEFGKPLPSSATPFQVRQSVQDMQSRAFNDRRARMKTLPSALIRTAHRHPFRFAMGDARRPRVKWGAVLLSSIFLARRLKKTWEGQEMVGVLLPPSVPGAMLNYAAVLAGKIPVNLNYTSSNETLASCGEQCKLQTTITTKLLLDRLPIKPPGLTILLEEVAAKPGLGEKIIALLLWPLPGRLLERILSGKRPSQLDDLATIVFSSGSTGEPKGVMLSHFNIVSNVEQMAQAVKLDRHDVLLGVLPFFHSFGFSVTLWLPAVIGIGVAYHPSPLDFGAIGALIREYRVTFLISTPTFLQGYLRKCQPEDFGSLRLVIVGAEKMPERVAAAFEDRFGIRPLEGYGCTECSPVVAVNTSDYRAPGFRQVGAKRGSIGHPLPGVTVRIVDPETREPLPLGQPGLLLVRGPNVMQGYLGKEKTTAEVLRDGWYSTGDIATLDEDGFLTITDRLSRFSKIGGEMVPHIKVEEKLHELAGATEMSFVVTGVPDGKKGERLVVLHSLTDEELKSVLALLPQSGLPNLWIPRANQFFHVEEFPHLGSGKLDLRRLREEAVELSKQE
jgi:acyl-[acyl-carrier-protein]-phospholipid O-acyltransferase/long-chain-fatty-acid--[acyl-carrier-protein] ligase